MQILDLAKFLTAKSLSDAKRAEAISLAEEILTGRAQQDAVAHLHAVGNKADEPADVSDVEAQNLANADEAEKKNRAKFAVTNEGGQ